MWFISLLKIAPNICPTYFYLSFYTEQNKLSLIFLKWYGCETGTKQHRDKGKNLTHPHRCRLPWSFEFRDCTPTDIRAELCMTLNQRVKFRSDLLQINTSIIRVRATDTINSLNCLQPTHTFNTIHRQGIYDQYIQKNAPFFRIKLFLFSGYLKYRWWRSSGLCWALGGVEPWFYKCHTLCLPITYFSVQCSFFSTCIYFLSVSPGILSVNHSSHLHASSPILKLFSLFQPPSPLCVHCIVSFSQGDLILPARCLISPRSCWVSPAELTAWLGALSQVWSSDTRCL